MHNIQSVLAHLDEQDNQKLKLINKSQDFLVHFNEDGRITYTYQNTIQHSDLIGNFLAHFGIKGMRWGIRRERGPDGTVGGNSRYALTKLEKSHDALRAEQTLHTLKKHGPDYVSTDDLNHLRNRLQTQRSLYEQDHTRIGRGQKFVKRILRYAATYTQAYEFLNTNAGRHLQQGLGISVLDKNKLKNPKNPGKQPKKDPKHGPLDVNPASVSVHATQHQTPFQDTMPKGKKKDSRVNDTVYKITHV